MLQSIPEDLSRDAWLAASWKQTWETAGPSRILQYIQDPGDGNDVEELIAKDKRSSSKLSEIDSEVSIVAANIRSFLPKLDYLEGQSRRNNIVIDGIQESGNESWAQSEEKVRKLLSDKLKLTGIEFERVHRTGRSTGERTRPIVAKFFRYKDKVRVMEKAKDLKGTNVYINEDYTDVVRQKRKELIPAMKAARERGDIAFLRHDKLIVHPASQRPRSQKSDT
ncbi:hypothetical protein AAFF_G00179230 [Aldrovandia affinis]|uniref:Uncharacterized protein n=1 Tax=Aldrovandia affinis TaxID=143900 RepID=A0AAD7W6R3_9TELE|nr:hypothetical protein AAFF_G00179230 [Aldrovandia affinis]